MKRERERYVNIKNIRKIKTADPANHIFIFGGLYSILAAGALVTLCAFLVDPAHLKIIIFLLFTLLFLALGIVTLPQIMRYFKTK